MSTGAMTSSRSVSITEAYGKSRSLDTEAAWLPRRAHAGPHPDRAPRPHYEEALVSHGQCLTSDGPCDQLVILGERASRSP